MRRTLLTVLPGALAVAAPGAGGLFVAGESRLRDVPELAADTDRRSTGAASIEHGRYIARTRGCFGCHGQELEGRVFADEWPWVARAVAPNLAAHARRHDEATLEAAIRDGVGHAGARRGPRRLTTGGIRATTIWPPFLASCGRHRWWRTLCRNRPSAGGRVGASQQVRKPTWRTGLSTCRR